MPRIENRQPYIAGKRGLRRSKGSLITDNNAFRSPAAAAGAAAGPISLVQRAVCVRGRKRTYITLHPGTHVLHAGIARITAHQIASYYIALHHGWNLGKQASK